MPPCHLSSGLKAVGESVAKPLEYYKNNITGTLILCEVMRKHNVKNIIFSSSATVYGDPAFIPITEECPFPCPDCKFSRRDFLWFCQLPLHGLWQGLPHGCNPLRRFRQATDFHTADKDWNVILLRYFNPIGAHKSGKIGEDPKGIPLSFFISVRIRFLPVPGIRTHFLYAIFRFPAQFLFGKACVGITGSNVSGSSFLNDIGNFMPARLSERLYNV